jgi:16S rRNA (guanine527-N7)-methyltransferase
MNDERYIAKRFEGTILENVPRETIERLEEFVVLLLKWNKRINLISKFSEGGLWERHILDSAQLYAHLNPETRVMDIGSGGGFPGIVLSIMGLQHISLIEADERKALFLQQAAKISKQSVTVYNKRVESVRPHQVECITARGFASIAGILDITKTWQEEASIPYLLLKGKRYEEELSEAEEFWDFESHIVPSLTNPEGVVIHLKNVHKKQPK